MRIAYDLDAPKRAANLSINADLLAQAREMGVNLSATLEEALVETLRRHRRAQWQAENAEAFEAYNDHVEKQGVFGDRLRSF